jgi:RIO kinase 1
MDAAWLIADPEPYEAYDLGSIKTGKEAEVFLVERVATDGRSCLLAHKRYRPRAVSHKGELQELGFQRGDLRERSGIPRRPIVREQP